MSKYFDEVLYAVCPDIRRPLENLSPAIKNSVNEIRLRKNKPLSLTVENETKYLSRGGALCDFASSASILVSSYNLEETFRLLCGNAVFAHEKELNRGFISMKNGSRCGVGGIYSSGTFLKPSSLNIRIAREITGAADKLICHYKLKGLLIAGPPASGKTTILRDFIRQLSEGGATGSHRIAVIDSRNELSHGNLNLGPNTDVICCENKAQGAQMAIRTLFPEFLAFDEIGTEEELASIEQCFFSGVSVITTAHIGTVAELCTRKVTKRLLESGAIEQVAILPKYRTEDIKLYNARELLNGSF